VTHEEAVCVTTRVPGGSKRPLRFVRESLRERNGLAQHFRRQEMIVAPRLSEDDANVVFEERERND